MHSQLQQQPAETRQMLSYKLQITQLLQTSNCPSNNSQTCDRANHCPGTLACQCSCKLTCTHHCTCCLQICDSASLCPDALASLDALSAAAAASRAAAGGSSTAAAPAPLDSAQLEKLLAALAASGEDECAICLSSMLAPCITRCAHVFCRR